MKLPGCTILIAAWVGVLAVHAEVVEIGAHHFTLPAGFTIELAAGPDLAPRPVSSTLDAQGRLYVTDSSGSNADPEEQLKNPQGRILRLEDTDGDGRYDRSFVFADHVMFPQGCLWHNGWIYVAGPPSIWRFRDNDGDGVADQREEWFKGGTLTHCANDIHGPYLGPDGYIYWTKGAFSEQKHNRPGKKPIQDRAAHIYRSRPDGSDLDVIMSGGMDNPVEVAFTAEGEAFFTSTFIDFSQPGWRDGIAYAVYGGVYGKQNDVIEDGRVVRTSPDWLHPVVQLGAGAPTGLCRYEGKALGAEYQDRFFASTFNLHKITAHALRPKGASYSSTDIDFVVSDNLDFHPTDVMEDIDGTLLVVDTGGWYKLCCPSSQLAKADVLGGIYRVHRSGIPIDTKSRTQITDDSISNPEHLVDLLGNGSWLRRHNAIEWLIAHGPQSIGPLASALMRGANTAQSQAAAWALFRIGGEPALETLSRAITHADPAIARTAAKCLALANAPSASLAAYLSSKDPAMQRNAAESFTRTSDPTSAEALLALGVRAAGDPVLEHAAVLALIQNGSASFLRPILQSSDPRARRIALIALDQINGGQLVAAEIGPLLSATDASLRQTARWIARKHPEWAESLIAFFRTRLSTSTLSRAEAGEWESQLSLLTRSSVGQDFLAELATQSPPQGFTRFAAVSAMASANLKSAPVSWSKALAETLGTSPSTPSSTELLGVAIRAASHWSTNQQLVTSLTALAARTDRTEDIRLKALSALPKGTPLDALQFQLVRTALDPAKSVASRTLASDVLLRARLEPSQLGAITDFLRSAGPIEFPKLVSIFEGGGDEALGQQFIGALQKVTATSMLRADLLRPSLSKFPPSIQAAGEALLASVHQDLFQQTAKLKTMLEEIKHLPGDVRRGQAVFNSPRAACITCHAIGYQGGHVGPDLTKISEVRSERDLLEAIVFPSASFVRSFEPMIVVTKDGEEHVGVVREESAEGIRLVPAAGAEVHLARADVSEIRAGTVSIMPTGLDEQISRQQLSDLIAFLKNTRWGPQ